MSYETLQSTPGSDLGRGRNPGADVAMPRAAQGVLPEGDILSCVVYTKPAMGGEVAARISGLPGVEVHCGADIDKLVITIEDVVDHRAADRMGALNAVEGVINTILIYHFGGQGLAPRSRGDELD